MSDNEFRPLPGSERHSTADTRTTRPVQDDEPIAVTVVLRRRAELPDELVTGAGTVSRNELTRRFGADPADVEQVRRVLTGQGLTVTEVDEGQRRVGVTGPAWALRHTFGARMAQVTTRDGASGAEVSHRQRESGLRVPAELDGVVVAVLGLDDRPQAQTRFRIARAGARVSYTPVQLGEIYAFPPGTDGAGQTIAIIELGGGFASAEVATYFADLGVGPVTVRAVGVDGARNRPGGDPGGADGEVLLDIEVAGGLAPGAELVVYFAPNTDRGFLDAVATAVHADPTPAAVSISWGLAEDAWTAQGRTSLNGAFTDAAALGVTVCAASGDGGSSDGVTDGAAHVDFPAASPFVLGCGGTSLHADPGTGRVRSETVWNDGTGGATGGGVSTVFDQPSYQSGAGVPARAGGGAGRGVPDVSADADPATGYQVLVDGSAQVIGGTSAVAPLWAALVTRLVQASGRPLGLLQPTLYGAAIGLRDITDGDNGAYPAGPGWDACTGLGVPVGTDLVALFAGAGEPPNPDPPGGTPT